MWVTIALLACAGEKILDTAVEPPQQSSMLADWTGTLVAGGELRWLIEGVVPSNTAVVISYEVTGSAEIDVTLFPGTGDGNAIWGGTFEDVITHEKMISCDEEICNFSYVTKAIHVAGSLDVAFQLAVYNDLEASAALVTLVD